VKVYKIEIALESTDPAVMRPAMRFRGDVETGRAQGLLLVPREAVFLRDRGPVVWTRRALRWTEVPVVLGRSSRLQVEIVKGLSPGDRVSPIDLREPAGAERQAAGLSR
jgi:multidrug efflux pump subunit AcrA (membrane-fusion protein)